MEILNLDEGTRKLVFILCLPLIDGVFATLLVTGAVSTFSDIIAVSLTIFSGAGALAILYSYSDSIQEAKQMVYQATPFLLAGAVAVGLIAPIFEQVFYVERLKYAAGLVVLVIAAQLADLQFSDRLSTPSILLAGMALSVRNPSVLAVDFSYVLPAVLTAAMASITLYLATYLRNRNMSITYIQRGAAIVLLIIGASLFGFNLPSEIGLAILSGSVLASIENPEFVSYSLTD